jgi:hypothetical protein
MQYTSGTFTVPASAGAYSVTGLGFAPDGILFFGTNRETEDAVVTGANLGAFFGMMARDWDSSVIIARSVSVIPSPKGSVITGKPIHVRSAPGSATPDYAASASSLDADGATVTFSDVPASGNRKVHWLAWGTETGSTGAHELHSDGGDQTLALGWQAKSLLELGSFEGGDGEAAYDGTHWLWCGAASYWGDPAIDWQAVNLTCVSSGQQAIRTEVSGASAVAVAHPNHAGVAGTILGGDLRVKPSGGGYTSLAYDYVSVSDSWDMTCFHDGESSNGKTTAGNSLGDTVDVALANAAVQDVAAILFLTTGDTDGFGTTLTGNLGVGVATADHQACVMIDGSSQALYQSSAKAWCDNVAAGGAHAGTAELGLAEFTLETTEAGGPSAAGMVYVAFGPNEGAIRHEVPFLGAGYA